MRGRGRVRLGWAAVLAVVVVAACIGGDDDNGDAGPEITAPADTIRLGVGGPLVVDPAEATLASASELMVLDLLHDGLTRIDADGVPQPVLAESWISNPAATAFQFMLRDDATFASGRAVTPQDVIASLEHVMAAGDSSLAALSLEAVQGFREFADGKAEHVSGLSAPGPRAVRIVLTTPLSELPAVLSSPLMSVVDAASIAGDLGDLDLSGDWAVESAEEGGLQLQARDQADGLQRVALSPHDDAEAAYEAFQDGAVDWAEVPADRYDEAVEDHGDDVFASFQAELYFGLNMSAPALRSAALRHAIALAIDREAIVEAVYAELADPLTTIVPAGIAGHDPERCDDCAHDPDAAEEALEAEFPDGKVPLVHIDFDESPVQEAMAEMVAEDLEAVGIPIDLRPKPLEEYKAFVVTGRQALFSFGWIGAYRSPDAYLAPLFDSDSDDNLTNYRSEAVDALLAAARASTDAAENADRWTQAEQEVLEADVVVPIAQFRTQVVVSGRVEGLEHAVDGTVDWAYVSLEG